MEMETDLLTTGQAAALLGCSRQHVVDLCDRGELRSTSIGTHRRLRRSDVETYAWRRTRGVMTTDQLRSLWLHRAVAGHVAADPDAVLQVARENARRFLARGPSLGSARWLRRWLRLLDKGPEPVMEMLTSTSGVGREMRQSSPFAGVLSEPERLAILRSFQQHATARG
jgi:excisionase family DNA binding protein